MRISPSLVVDVREVIEQFIEILDTLYFGMGEGSVVGPMRHHDDSVGLGRHVFAIFMAVVDEQFDPHLLDHL